MHRALRIITSTSACCTRYGFASASPSKIGFHNAVMENEVGKLHETGIRRY